MSVIPRQARIKSQSKIYHIVLRGANKQEIFQDDEDCNRFLYTIEKYKREAELSVYAWCLMSNHIHLLLREGNESISATMKRIGVSFVRYYNFKYQTTGHLFQDRFRSENVETERYLRTVVRYIHQNPVKAGIVKRAEEWKWSSCWGYYYENTYSRNLLDGNFVLGLFSEDLETAKQNFKVFNEKMSNDHCLEGHMKSRLTDEDARQIIKRVLGPIEIAQVRSLSRLQRNEILREVKSIDGLSHRQLARILGISPTLIFKA